MSKKALVMSGGGSKGSHSVGILKYLVKEQNKTYDVFAGVSVGALNCIGMASFKNEKEAIDNLERIWLEIDTRKIYKHWKPFSYLHGLWKTSLYNSSPLKKLIDKEFNEDVVRKSNKKLRIGVVSVNSKAYKIFTENSSDLKLAVLASSAFPLMFSAVNLNNEYFLDGGLRNVSPIKSAIYADKDVDEIDVILTFPKKKYKYENIKKPNVIKIASRSLEIILDEISENDIKMAQYINKLIKFGADDIGDKRLIKINIFRPDDVIDVGSLDFNSEKIKENIELGYKLAEKLF